MEEMESKSLVNLADKGFEAQTLGETKGCYQKCLKFGDSLQQIYSVVDPNFVTNLDSIIVKKICLTITPAFLQHRH